MTTNFTERPECEGTLEQLAAFDKWQRENFAGEPERIWNKTKPRTRGNGRRPYGIDIPTAALTKENNLTRRK